MNFGTTGSLLYAMMALLELSVFEAPPEEIL